MPPVERREDLLPDRADKFEPSRRSSLMGLEIEEKLRRNDRSDKVLGLALLGIVLSALAGLLVLFLK